MPCYSILFSSVRESVIEEYDEKLKQQLELMENEINLQRNVLKAMSREQDFQILSNPSTYNYNTNSVKWFECRESVRSSFAMLDPIVSLQDKSMLLFRNGDLQIDINGAANVLSAGYDSMWNLSDGYDVYSFEGAMAQIFMKNHVGKIDRALCYNNLSEERSYELVYALTMSSSDEEVGNSTFIVCYDADKLMERLGFLDNTMSVCITSADNGLICNYGTDNDISVYDSYYENENLNLKIHYIVSDNYIRQKLEPVNFFLTIFCLGFLLFGFVGTIGISFGETHHIKKLVSIVNGTTDIKYSGEDDYFKYIETIVRGLNNRVIKATENTQRLIFFKMLYFKLTPDELESVQKYFDSSVCVFVLKNTEAKYRDLVRGISSYLKSKNVEIIHIADVENSEVVVFVKKVQGIRDVFEDMIMYLNKEQHTDIRGVVSVCEDITLMPDIYRKIKKIIPYLEYGNLKSIDVNSFKSSDEDFKLFIIKSRQLYEIIRSGNEFEAKRNVYEQWYKITQGETDPNMVEPLFFSQSSVLSQIVSEHKLNVAIPRFDSGKDAVSIAFEITECIEQICEKMKGNSKREDVRSNQIIEYIEQRYCDSSFYMPELVGKFELSDRAIVQILKKATGDNFSNYVSKLRISKAEELLSGTNTPVAEVAVASGFDSSNSLYKAFKKVYGVSPSMYRENRKSEK